MDPGYEVHGVFLDISKAFDKVWHKDLLHKLKENGINGALLNVLGPLLFLIYINDPSDDFHSNPKLFADNTSLFSTVHNIAETTNQLNMDEQKKAYGHISEKCCLTSKQAARGVVVSRKIFKISHPSLTFNNILVAQVGSLKHLGISLDSKLNFNEHLDNIQSKVNRIIRIICNLQNVLPRSALLTIYKSFARPHLDYGDTI